MWEGVEESYMNREFSSLHCKEHFLRACEQKNNICCNIDSCSPGEHCVDTSSVLILKHSANDSTTKVLQKVYILVFLTRWGYSA